MSVVKKKYNSEKSKCREGVVGAAMVRKMPCVSLGPVTVSSMQHRDRRDVTVLGA